MIINKTLKRKELEKLPKQKLIKTILDLLEQVYISDIRNEFDLDWSYEDAYKYLKQQGYTKADIEKILPDLREKY